VGLRETTEPLGASALVEGFSLARLARVPEEIRVDPSDF
jgi:hypothetical protein